MKVKKHQLFFLLLFLLGHFRITNVYAQAVPELIYYKFDAPGTSVQNFASSPVGTGPGTVVGGASISGFGQFGTALQGTGGITTSNSVNANWPLSLAGPWTMSMWLSGLTSNLTDNFILGGAGGSLFRASTGTLTTGAGDLTFRAVGMTEVKLNSIFDATGTPVVVHLVYDPTIPAIQAYVNGVLNKTVSQTASMTLSGTNFTIGGFATNNGLPSTGKMDEFRLYNRALTATEIANTWNVMLPYIPSPNDAGVTALDAPVSPVTPGPQAIQVTIKNLGTSTLTSAQIGWKVENTTGAPYAWTGSLAPGSSSAPITIGTHNFTIGTNLFKTWTSMPNGQTDGNQYNDTLRTYLNVCNILNGTYTINQSAPASATNFISFDAALQALNSCGISGPVTFNVVSGTGPYNEKLIFSPVNGASATNTITFNGNGNTITSAVSSIDAVITLDNADYFRFNNLTVATNASSTDGSVVMLINRANNNIFSNNTLTHSITTTNTSYVAYVYSGSSNNTFQNNTISGAYYGIYNYSTASNPVIENSYKNNIVQDQYLYGIYNGQSSGTLIEGNDISRPNRSNSSLLYCIYNGTGSVQYTITKNKMHNTHDMATSTTGAVYGVYSSVAAVAGSESIISNNIIYNINNNGGAFYGFYNSGGNNIYYYHNTVSADMPNVTYGTLRGMYFLSAAINVKFINNLMSLTSSATNKHAIYLSATNIDLQSNNNDLFIGSSGNIGYYSGNKATMTDWQAVNSSTYDQNSVSIDPQFVNLTTGNLKPIKPQLNNTGQALAAITTDITGATRSTTTPDPGAYEFTPPVNDAGIVAYVAPGSPLIPASNVPVQFTIQNFGTATLTSATINWTVNGVAQTPYSWTGSLTNNQTATVTIGSYSFTSGAYTIEACSSLPNGVTDDNPGNNCFSNLIHSCNALSGNFTINKNLPASATNFSSLAEAGDRVTNCGISGPVTFTVAAGTGPYNEQLILGIINGASATNTVTFEGNGNTISANPTGSNIGAITLDGADYVKINNFVITMDSAATAGWGIQLKNEADHNIISNNTLNMSLTSTNSLFNGIVAAATISTAGNNANYTMIQNNAINGGYYGIQLNGMNTASALHNQIIGNQIKDAYIYGIHLNFTDSTIVRGNDISRPNRTTSSTFTGIYVTNLNVKMEISKNRIHNPFGGVAASNSAANVIYFSNCDAPVGSENVIKNNLIYDINTNGFIYGFYNVGSDGAHFIHNTVVLDNASNTGTVRGIYQTSGASNIKVVNNIFSVNGTSGVKHALYFGTTTSSIVSNNNVFHLQYGNVGYYGADFPTLANWQAANSNAYDSSSVAADPVFTNPTTGNYKPTSVAVGDIGQPGTGVTDDITGTLRNATTPDPGAYEFGVLPDDVGIVTISGPVTGCALTANETISVTIKNFGSSPQTSIPVSYSVNNSLPVTQTWAGTLAPNTTATLTFTQTADMSVAGPYTIIASTQLTGDGDASNDADTLTVTNSLMPAGTVNIDFELPASGVNALRVVTNPQSRIYEDSAASAGTGFKGMIMDAVNSSAWIIPSAAASPWTINPDNFSAVYLCFTPQAGKVDDSLFLEFDLKQLYKTTHFNTSFRVMVNGQQIGTSYNPPFGGYGTGVAPWTHVKLDISSYLNNQTIEIGLESSVKEEYDNGNGTANLVDNIMVQRVAGPTVGTGVKENLLQSNVVVFPNPSNGIFNLKVPATTRSYSVEVTDLTGKVVKQQLVKNNSGAEQLNLNGTAKGIYILKIASEGNVATRRLIVE